MNFDEAYERWKASRRHAEAAPGFTELDSVSSTGLKVEVEIKGSERPDHLRSCKRR